MSYSFNGTSSYMARTASLPFTGPSASIALWVKNAVLTGIRTTYVQLLASSAGTNAVRLGHGTTNLGSAEHRTTANGVGLANANSANIMVANTWTHVAGVYSNGSLRSVFVNNVKFSDTTVVGAYSATINTLRLGNHNSSPSDTEWLNGLLAYVGLWNVALTDSDITALQTAAPDVAQSTGLAAYYSFATDKGSSTYADDVGTYNLTNNGATFSSDMPVFGGAATLAGSPTETTTLTGALSTTIKLAGAAVETTTQTAQLSGNKHIVEDMVMEATTTSGLIDIVLAGAVLGFRTFASVLGSGDTCVYLMQAIIAGAPSGQWEQGLGTFNSGTNTLVRSQVISSSNNGLKINFSAGSSLVSLTEGSKLLSNHAIYDNGVSGASITIDWANGPYQQILLTSASPVLNLKNLSMAPRSVLEVIQDTVGGRTPSIPGASFAANSPVVWSTLPNSKDVLEFFYNRASEQIVVFQRVPGHTLQDFVSSGNVGNFTITLPPGYAIDGILFKNPTINAVTGGIKIGTNSGTTDVAASIAIPANADLWVPHNGLSKLYAGAAAPQTYYFQAVTSWNGAQVSAKILAKYTGPLA